MKQVKGLALSGGGKRGMGHLGALKAMEESGLLARLENVSGSSVGSIVGALLVAGYSPSELIDIADRTSFPDLYDVNLGQFDGNFGICSGKRLRSFLTSLLAGKGLRADCRIADAVKLTGIKLTVSAFDLNGGTTVYFDENNACVSLTDAVMCSCAVPFLFASPEISGRRYMDGAMFDFLPLSPLLKIHPAEEVLGVSLAAPLTDRAEPFRSASEFFQRVLDSLFDHVNGDSVFRSGANIWNVFGESVPSDPKEMLRASYETSKRLAE